jgi:arginine deiminase
VPDLSAGDPAARQPGGEVTRIDLTKRNISFSPQKSLLGALKKRRIRSRADLLRRRQGVVDQQREQWTDGANAFTLAPGIVLLYERNVRTAEELNAHGYNIVYEDDLLLGRTELETWTDKKYALQMARAMSFHARAAARGA